MGQEKAILHTDTTLSPTLPDRIRFPGSCVTPASVGKLKLVFSGPGIYEVRLRCSSIASLSAALEGSPPFS